MAQASGMTDENPSRHRRGVLLVGLYFVGKSVGTVTDHPLCPIPRHLQTPHEVQLSLYLTALRVACMALDGSPQGFQGGPRGSHGWQAQFPGWPVWLLWGRGVAHVAPRVAHMASRVALMTISPSVLQ